MRCPLLRPEDDLALCDLASCAKPLEGKRRRWCSDECHFIFMANHAINFARNFCRDAARVWNGEQFLGWRCAHCLGITQRPEVNHLDPVLTREMRLGFGCHHHQSGLETLCKTCHLAVTTAQRRAGWKTVTTAITSSLFPNEAFAHAPCDRPKSQHARGVRRNVDRPS